MEGRVLRSVCRLDSCWQLLCRWFSVLSIVPRNQYPTSFSNIRRNYILVVVDYQVKCVIQELSGLSLIVSAKIGYACGYPDLGKSLLNLLKKALRKRCAGGKGADF